MDTTDPIEEPILIYKSTEDDKKKFYKPYKVYEHSFDLLFTELYCLTNPEKLVINGDENGDIISMLWLYFVECDSKTSKN